MREATTQDILMEIWLRERNSGEIVWRTRNGNNVAINEMTDTHLKNVLNMLERNEHFLDAIL
jgi:hypothetical protein